MRSDKRDDDLLLKIGIHEGPCLAVMLNERQDYFGQTVNIASRVQHLASSQAIYATGAVVGHKATAQLLAKAGVSPVPSAKPFGASAIASRFTKSPEGRNQSRPEVVS